MPLPVAWWLRDCSNPTSAGRRFAVYHSRSGAVKPWGCLDPNGAGKTTVFYMITGLIAADSGTISLDGADITHLPMYRRARLGIGYLPQESSIFRGLTVEENIRAVLELTDTPRSRRDSVLQ